MPPIQSWRQTGSNRRQQVRSARSIETGCGHFGSAKGPASWGSDGRPGRERTSRGDSELYYAGEGADRCAARTLGRAQIECFPLDEKVFFGAGLVLDDQQLLPGTPPSGDRGLKYRKDEDGSGRRHHWPRPGLLVAFPLSNYKMRLLRISGTTIYRTKQNGGGSTMTQSDIVLSLATKIASSNFGNKKLGQEEIPGLSSSVREALSKLESGELVCEPAGPIDKSTKQSEIICLECGNAEYCHTLASLERGVSTARPTTSRSPLNPVS